MAACTRSGQLLYLFLVDRELRKRCNRDIHNYILFSGLLTTSTFLGTISPYADHGNRSNLARDEKQTLFMWVRFFTALSFLLSLLCVTVSFLFWGIINNKTRISYQHKLERWFEKDSTLTGDPKSGLVAQQLGRIHTAFIWSMKFFLDGSTLSAVIALDFAAWVYLHNTALGIFGFSICVVCSALLVVSWLFWHNVSTLVDAIARKSMSNQELGKKGVV